MIRRTCPYHILKHKQCSHFPKTILSILNWLISRVKNHVKRKSYHSIFKAMMIYPIVHFKRLGSRHIHKEIEIS